jgi:FkbM family methyltransferase
MIDCGAHDGGDSIELQKVIGGTVYSFEPSPKVYERLVKYTSHNKNIRCFPIALSNENGKASFHISEGKSDGSSSLLKPKEHLTDHPTVLFNEVLEVDTMTLDDWAKKYNVPHVDLLWLDMQGFEMNMLMASKKILDTVKVIHTEVSVKDTYDGVIQYPKFRDWLISKGFEPKLECIPEGFDMGNVLFIRKK